MVVSSVSAWCWRLAMAEVAVIVVLLSWLISGVFLSERGCAPAARGLVFGIPLRVCAVALLPRLPTASSSPEARSVEAPPLLLELLRSVIPPGPRAPRLRGVLALR